MLSERKCSQNRIDRLRVASKLDDYDVDTAVSKYSRSASRIEFEVTVRIYGDFDLQNPALRAIL